MRKTATLATIVSCWTLAAGGPSCSADLPAAKAFSPRPLAIEGWTGFYVGLGGGPSSLNNRINAQPGPSLDSPGISASLDGLGANGWLATVNIGYDYQINPSVVIGVFGDYDFHQLKSQLDLDVSGAPFSAHGNISIKQQWSIGGRVGYLASSSTLIFLSGGYTRLGLSDFRVSVSSDNPPTVETATAYVPTISTGFIGAGLETKLTSTISLRGEYRYSGFGGGNVTLPTIDGTDLNNFLIARITPTFQVVKASLNYRF